MGAAASSLGRPVYMCHACDHKFFPEEETTSATTTSGGGGGNDDTSEGSNEAAEASASGNGPKTCPRCGSDFLELGRAVNSDVADVMRAAAANGVPMVGLGEWGEGETPRRCENFHNTRRDTCVFFVFF